MRKKSPDLNHKAKKIRLLLLDVDGVLTDGSIILDNRGNETKAFHVRDGRGIKLAQNAGIQVGIITGRSSEVVNIRARELAINEVHQAVRDKIAVYEDIISRHAVSDEEVAYIGDDDVDLQIFRRVGLAVTVADADPCVRSHVHMITANSGGRGAVREAINFILKTKGMLRSV
jgi:3-deoxy-D-manno-octulosonate 8-phosphate phosphatase (KDO 8-P phosphatase)